MKYKTADLLKQMQNFIDSHSLFDKKDKILIGVSGGADSVALLDLLYRSKYNIAIAHCNFLLRGQEAFRDENFVKTLSERYKIPLFSKQCNTKQFAEKNGISIEMAARQLRYSFFNSLLQKHNFDYIATAHNADDNIETFLINLSRKTGIKGLLGIPVKNNKIVRPLLFAYKNEIIEYCRKQNLPFVEDSTNKKNIFHRNKIRNQIIPLFENINPAFKRNITETMQNLKEVYDIYLEQYQIFKNQCITEEKKYKKIKTECLKNKFAKTFLIEFLAPYGFSISQIDNILKSAQAQPGKVFYSKNYRLLKDRNFLLLAPHKTLKDKIFYIDDQEGTMEFKITENEYIRLKIQKRNKPFEIEKKTTMAFLDYDKLSFPLILRKNRPGDSFQPLGMKGTKKLSDFLKDLKLPYFEKKEVFLLESNNEIIWVVGYRINDKYKITSDTQTALIITLL